MSYELEIEPRKELGSRKVKQLRAAGKLPAVVYGAGKDAASVVVDALAFKRLMSHGERVVALKQGGDVTEALLKDVQWDHLGEEILHADFHALKPGQTVRVRVRIVIKGTPKGATIGGRLQIPMHDTEVECEPKNVPEYIDVDVSHLNVGEIMHLSDVKWPEGVTSASKTNDVVAVCAQPRGGKVKTADAAEATEGEEGAEG